MTHEGDAPQSNQIEHINFTAHDPLCHSRNVDGFPCYTCALIKKVRTESYRQGYNDRGLADAKSQAMFGKWGYDPQASDNRP